MHSSIECSGESDFVCSPGPAPAESRQLYKRESCVVCSPAQFAEETKRADRTVPWAIVLSLSLNAVLGILYILVILFCLPVSPGLSCMTFKRTGFG